MMLIESSLIPARRMPIKLIVVIVGLSEPAASMKGGISCGTRTAADKSQCADGCEMMNGAVPGDNGPIVNVRVPPKRTPLTRITRFWTWQLCATWEQAMRRF